MATEQSCFHTSLLFPGAQLIFIVQCKLVYKYLENCQLLMMLCVCSLITDQPKLLAADHATTCCFTPTGGGPPPSNTRSSRFAPDKLLSSGYDVHSSHTPTYHVTRPGTGPTHCFIIDFSFFRFASWLFLNSLRRDQR